MKVVTREEMQAIDRKAIDEIGIPGVVLMENAGRTVADVVTEMLKKGATVTIICGKGNNGGDGFVCARHLYNRGFNVKVFLLGKMEDVKGDAKINLDILIKMGFNILKIDKTNELNNIAIAITETEIIVDAIFGTGLGKEVQGLEADTIKIINNSQKPVVAIDIPSGLDCNKGIPLGIAVRATKTVTMGLRKIGFDKPGARELTGEVIVADIGVPRDLSPHQKLERHVGKKG